MRKKKKKKSYRASSCRGSGMWNGKPQSLSTWATGQSHSEPHAINLPELGLLQQESNACFPCLLEEEGV